MTDKVSQIYKEEQINKTRNGRKIVPDNKMPNLQWNLEKRDAMRKEEVQETQEIKTPNRIQEVIIYIVISIYSSILSIQHTVVQCVNSTIETTQELVTTIRGISHTSWTKSRRRCMRNKNIYTHNEETKKNSGTDCVTATARAPRLNKPVYQVDKTQSFFAKDRGSHENPRTKKHQSQGN